MSIKRFAHIFTNAKFEEVFKTGNSSTIDRYLLRYADEYGVAGRTSRMELLNDIYERMTSDYRCEYVYKNYITNKILLGRHSVRTSTILNEVKVGRSVADAVFINGKATVYEIKTELDTPDRLIEQLNDYQKAFPIVYVVCHITDSDKYAKVINNSPVGLIALTHRHQLSVRKEASYNVDHLNPQTIFKLLRKEEYTEIVCDTTGSIPSVPNVHYYKTCLRILSQLNPDEFHSLAIKQLKKRISSTADITASEAVPIALKHISITSLPPKKEITQFIDYLDSTIH